MKNINMYKVKFHTYIGLAGDIQELLVATSEYNNNRVSCLIPRSGMFINFRIKLAKKRLVKELNKKTGKTHSINPRKDKLKKLNKKFWNL